MEISTIIAENLKRLRQEQNLSLGQLAEKAGVSKVMLSQLEKGNANPTINTVWKITGALGVPYTQLLDQPQVKTLHVKKRHIHELCEDGYHIFSYYPKNGERPFELYEIEMDPHCEHPSIGHSSNSSEYILVVEGTLTMILNGEVYTLDRDDGFCFDASVPHTYFNDSEKQAKAVLLIYYP